MMDKSSVEINIPFPSNRLAQIAYDVLRVDAEPKRGGVKKELSHEENILKAVFKGDSARQLRVGVNCYFENIILVLQTYEFAGEPVSESYSHFEITNQ